MMKKLLLSLTTTLLLTSSIAVAQEEKQSSAVSVDYSVDLVSRYVWRGLLYSANPNIQPTISLTAGNFSVGSWASYGMSQEYYSEVDLFATYSIGNFSFTVYDYYNEYESKLDSADYFHWDRKTTGHALEGTLAWSGTESFPLSITGAVFFYGNDRNSTTLDQNYSTYLELGYPVTLGDYNIDLFIGGTFNEGLYNDEANIVNVGFKTSKEIEITDKFKLPVSATFAVNPAKEDIFFVVGITL
ncbi:hypothetical protein CYCD_28800 [Tenuifilaceae bacterium CYCD]|nr:hypothetical protein CYCD_28800 [Tenuifilaceae bacterium CYCD]